MKFGYLAQFFSAFAWKRVTSVEVDPTASNGHEFNSSSHLRTILGTTTRSCKAMTGIPTRFVYLSDGDDEVVSTSACMSWYDARANHSKRTEWRLYYTDNSVIGREGRSRASDLLVIAFAAGNESATVFVAESGSTSLGQLCWLFGIADESATQFETAEVQSGQVVDMTRARILETAGIVLSVEDDSLLERMLALFGKEFPTSAVFSDFVRSELPDVHGRDDPDAVIMSWMEREEFAFRVLERFIVEERLKQGFKNVDDFVACSLSVHNRRKSRAGLAFENHLGEVFRAHGLAFDRAVTVEDGAKPDFLFPGMSQYFDDTFAVELLTLLGAKTSCKDRWRQVLAESARVEEKHLITLEPAISANQIAQMRRHNLQLVVPNVLHPTYPSAERENLWDLTSFIGSVFEKQNRAGLSPYVSGQNPKMRNKRASRQRGKKSL